MCIHTIHMLVIDVIPSRCHLLCNWSASAKLSCSRFVCQVYAIKAMINDLCWSRQCCIRACNACNNCLSDEMLGVCSTYGNGAQRGEGHNAPHFKATDSTWPLFLVFSVNKEQFTHMYIYVMFIMTIQGWEPKTQNHLAETATHPRKPSEWGEDMLRFDNMLLYASTSCMPLHPSSTTVLGATYHNHTCAQACTNGGQLISTSCACFCIWMSSCRWKPPLVASLFVLALYCMWQKWPWHVAAKPHKMRGRPQQDRCTNFFSPRKRLFRPARDNQIIICMLTLSTMQYDTHNERGNLCIAGWETTPCLREFDQHHGCRHLTNKRKQHQTHIHCKTHLTSHDKLFWGQCDCLCNGTHLATRGNPHGWTGLSSPLQQIKSIRIRIDKNCRPFVKTYVARLVGHGKVFLLPPFISVPLSGWGPWVFPVPWTVPWGIRLGLFGLLLRCPIFHCIVIFLPWRHLGACLLQVPLHGFDNVASQVHRAMGTFIRPVAVLRDRLFHDLVNSLGFCILPQTQCMHHHIQDVISRIDRSICRSVRIAADVLVMRPVQPSWGPPFPRHDLQGPLQFTQPQTRIHGPIRHIPWLQTSIRKFGAIRHTIFKNGLQSRPIRCGVWNIFKPIYFFQHGDALHLFDPSFHCFLHLLLAEFLCIFAKVIVIYLKYWSLFHHLCSREAALLIWCFNAWFIHDFLQAGRCRRRWSHCRRVICNKVFHLLWLWIYVFQQSALAISMLQHFPRLRLPFFFLAHPAIMFSTNFVVQFLTVAGLYNSHNKLVHVGVVTYARTSYHCSSIPVQVCETM